MKFYCHVLKLKKLYNQFGQKKIDLEETGVLTKTKDFLTRSKVKDKIYSGILVFINEEI